MVGLLCYSILVCGIWGKNLSKYTFVLEEIGQVLTEPLSSSIQLEATNCYPCLSLDYTDKLL